MIDKVLILIVMDRSGSMSSIRDDAVGGFNEFVAEQSKMTADVHLSLVMFNHEYKMVYDDIPISGAGDIGKKYRPHGMTALYDAVGRAIDGTGRKLSQMQDHERPDKVIVVIITDGMENASRDYTAEDVRKRVRHQEENYSWEFVFLGANIDSFAVAGGIGIQQQATANFDHTGDGIRLAYTAVSGYMFESVADGEQKSTLSAKVEGTSGSDKGD